MEETLERNKRKERVGIVTSDKKEKTRIVKVPRKFRHKFYRKVLTRNTKFYVHDEKNESRLGDEVRIQESRPLSKLKRWRLVEVVNKA